MNVITEAICGMMDRLNKSRLSSIVDHNNGFSTLVISTYNETSELVQALANQKPVSFPFEVKLTITLDTHIIQHLELDVLEKYRGDSSRWKPQPIDKCNCTIVQLTTHGCKCGGK